MILAGFPLSRGPIAVTSEVLANMAEKSGRPVEFTSDAGYLTVGRQTFRAELPPVGGAR